MRIGIDARLLENRMTGIGRYLAGILKYIPEIDRENEYYLFSFSDLDNYKKRGFKVIATGEKNLIPSRIFSPLWLNFVLPKFLKKNKIDLFFEPNYFLPLSNKEIKNVITVHDLFQKIDKNYQQFYYRKYLDFFLPRAIKNSNAIIAVSENTKKDIIEFYNISEGKINVIYEAADEIFQPRDLDKEHKQKLISKYNLPSEFILYVGVIENRKNITGILKIADILQKNKNNIKITLIGNPGFGFKQIYEDIKNKNNIYYLDNIEGEDLPYIYNLAKIFLFPSFYEGFGLPPLEAMQSGIPVLSSNTSSLPEVVGEGGIMHNPEDYESFSQDIIKLLEDRDFYDKIRRKGIRQARNFSWRETAKKIVGIFNQVYRNKI